MKTLVEKNVDSEKKYSVKCTLNQFIKRKMFTLIPQEKVLKMNEEFFLPMR